MAAQVSKTPKPSKKTAAPLIPPRILAERSWAYGLWLQRVSWDDMRRAANLPTDQGGLGYDLSLSALKGLVEGAKADRGDLTLKREDRLERQTFETDERARAAIHDLMSARNTSAKLDAAIARFQVEGIHDLAELAALGTLADQRSKMAREIEAAERRLEVAQEREAKLHGLNAPVEAKLDVTHHKDVADELNAMLGRAGTPTPEALDGVTG